MPTTLMKTMQKLAGSETFQSEWSDPQEVSNNQALLGGLHQPKFDVLLKEPKQEQVTRLYPVKTTIIFYTWAWNRHVQCICCFPSAVFTVFLEKRGATVAEPALWLQESATKKNSFGGAMDPWFHVRRSD